MRRGHVEGLSRLQLLRTSVGAGIGLWLLEVTLIASTMSRAIAIRTISAVRARQPQVDRSFTR